MDGQNRWNLDSDTVVNIQPFVYKDVKTCTVGDLKQKIRQTLGELCLLSDGVSCKLLEPGQPWKKGKIQIVIEFQPEENEPVGD